MNGVDGATALGPGTSGVARDSEIRICRLGAPSAEWDDFAKSQPDSTFCHLANWHAVMGSTLGTSSHCLEARGPEDQIVGLLPLVRVRSRLLGDHLLSMPFLNYGGALGSAPARAALAGEAMLLAVDLGVHSLELRSRDRETSALRPDDRKIIVDMPLPSTDEELWAALRSKVRSQVRRPMKEGMEAREGHGELDAFYRVFAANMRDLGTPVLPRRFFEAAMRAFPEEILFLTIRHQGEPVAAGCGFLHGEEFEITWASSRRESNHLAPNMVLYWELMRAAIRSGGRRFNFGRCTPGGGTHRFKLQWGGADRALGWSSWSRDGATGRPTSDRPALRLATRMWQRLPLWAANAVGPRVSRWLP